ncbi:sugar ABC transporter permease [Brachybacterium muris]|nr:sugar ABC transporter permease [Brachybacterium muris]MCT1431165.1 sugar ABC transporter permease [Brachybacterium muris]MCT1655083.1 sugar ABC transporter permease [Brachybacterium muris]MCT1998697.1 sugar ABC transporter permease [Brachybacterium muris]MCT2178188.1 sugar ABC transporter permease [Brachybacterium muris]MCT2262538.1 sugar ABC transporter permease [Brachybacterium muris]
MTIGPVAGLGEAAATANTVVRRRRRRVPTVQRMLFFLLFLGVPLAVYVMFVVSPFVQSFYYSLTSWSGLSPSMEFIGLENYRRIFADDVFWKSLRNNLILLIVLPTVTITLAFALAVMVTIGGDTRGGVRGVRGASFYRVVSFFPYAIPAVITGILFNFVYHPNGGLLNGILNLPHDVLTWALGSSPIPAMNIAWLGDQKFALGAIAFAIIWTFVGFYMVLFVAAIKSIGQEVLEAARIDGAGRFRTAVQVVAPMVRDSVSTALVYMGIFALDAFTFVSVMTPNGGTANSTKVVSLHLYQTAFQNGRFGEASAMGVIMALVTMVVAVLVITVIRPKKADR